MTPYRAVKKAVSRLIPGSTALIIGFGGLGQYGLQYLKLLTSARVIVVESSASKRELAKSLGADVVLDGTRSISWRRSEQQPRTASVQPWTSWASTPLCS